MQQPTHGNSDHGALKRRMSTRTFPQILRSHGSVLRVKRSLAEWALRFIWGQPEVNVVLSGMSATEHVKENIQIAEEGYANLTSEEKNLIHEVREVYETRIHVGCTACGYSCRVRREWISP